MAKFIKQRTIQHITEYDLMFYYVEDPNCGYGFPCDKHGSVFAAELTDVAKQTLQECFLNAEGMYLEGVVRPYHKRVTHAAIIECKCGRHHALENYNRMGDSFCKCGQWYNAVGQELLPPEQWGEDTNERFDNNGNCLTCED